MAPHATVLAQCVECVAPRRKPARWSLSCSAAALRECLIAWEAPCRAGTAMFWVTREQRRYLGRCRWVVRDQYSGPGAKNPVRKATSEVEDFTVPVSYERSAEEPTVNQVFRQFCVESST